MDDHLLLPRERDFYLYAVGVIVGCMTLIPSLHLPPVNADDLMALSQAITTDNPLDFFTKQWVGLNKYRPIQSALIWITHHAFGFDMMINQALNLVLHTFVSVLLLLFLWSYCKNRLIAFLLTMTFALSFLYVRPSATWVADRGTVIVGLCLIGTLCLLIRGGSRIGFGRGVCLVALSVAAPLAKEPGMIVPFAVAFWLVFFCARTAKTWGLAAGFFSINLVYVAVRVLVLPGDALQGSGGMIESTYLLGLFHYGDDQLAVASQETKYAIVADNMIKYMIAPVIRLFGWEGDLKLPMLGHGRWQFYVVFTILYVLLFVLVNPLKRRGRIQLLGLLIICSVAVIHFMTFRDRGLYLSEMGLVMILAVCFGARYAHFWDSRPNNLFLIQLCLLAIVFVDVVAVQYRLSGQLVQGQKEISQYDLERVLDQARSLGEIDKISPVLIETIRQQQR